MTITRATDTSIEHITIAIGSTPVMEADDGVTVMRMFVNPVTKECVVIQREFLSRNADGTPEPGEVVGTRLATRSERLQAQQMIVTQWAAELKQREIELNERESDLARIECNSIPF